jgi:hypothetical protein
VGSCECAHSRSHDRLRRVSKKTGTQMTTRRSEVDRQNAAFFLSTREYATARGLEAVQKDRGKVGVIRVV